MKLKKKQLKKIELIELNHQIHLWVSNWEKIKTQCQINIILNN
jgi:hypothetical protein